jgi:hypothetical protein
MQYILDIVVCTAVAMRQPDVWTYQDRFWITARKTRSRETNNGTVPLARQHILNKATVGLQQWKCSVFFVVLATRL